MMRLAFEKTKDIKLLLFDIKRETVRSYDFGAHLNFNASLFGNYFCTWKGKEFKMLGVIKEKKRLVMKSRYFWLLRSGVA